MKDLIRPFDLACVAHLTNFSDHTDHSTANFINRLTKSWLEKNDIEMYLKHNEGKSVVA